RRATPAVDAMLAQLDGDSFAPELQRSLVEANTLPCESLDELRAELCRLRRRLNEVADPLGLGVVATGTVPLVDLLGTNISAGARYERMQHEYQLLVREQHICGVQVHVDVPDRDVAVAVVQHVALHLPTFLALSASSPYWRAVDSGYASYRRMIWQRWPTAGPPDEGLVGDLRPELEAFGDWKQVLELSNEPLPRAAPRPVNAGCSAVAASSPTWLALSSPRLAASRCTATRRPWCRRRRPCLTATSMPAATVLAMTKQRRPTAGLCPHYGRMFRVLDRLQARGMAAGTGMRTGRSPCSVPVPSTPPAEARS
ncbi:MAG TPA: glutamate-cysteine ligase family protein, partial [Jatrophihabitans sp.]|nr:glutamate-cysteine ligase family protein [Jatrophihabitans sp.]